MRRLIIAVVLLTGINYTVYAQQNFATDLIPKNLLPYASAVVRTDESTINIKDNDNVLEHVKQVITVLNKNGDNAAQLVLGYNKMQHIKSAKGIIYNEYGKPVSKFGESDFKDQSNANDFSLFEDIRIKYYTPAITTYPYTIEYDYDIQYNQSLGFPSWEPARNTGLAIENSSFTVICKPGINIRYKEMSYPGQVQTSTDDKGIKTYNWKLANVPARRYEPYSPDLETNETRVRVAPQSFSYGGLTGTCNSWNELGKWIYDKLLVGRSELPPETVQKITALTADVTAPKEKAKKIYEYMQQKNRYVSIQIGIGNEQPFPASEVDRLSYGDCKGLVNYTQALFKAVGIESYYCMVTSGSYKENFSRDFASMEGDHVILCLPFKNDTTWLECTSKTSPFGYLGTFTDDRWVLACTSQGGKLLHTPKYTAQENREVIKANFNLSEKGELKGDITTNATGTQYENEEGMLTESFQDQLKHIQKQYPISNLDVESFKFSADKSIKPVLTESVKFNAFEYALADSGKLRFTINSVNRISNVPHEIRNRNNPLYINRGYTDEDIITYTIPEGYQVDRTLLNIKLQKEFGNYTANVTVKGNQLIYSRKMQLIDGTYSKEAYSEFVDFYQAIVDADNYSVTMVKNK